MGLLESLGRLFGGGPADQAAAQAAGPLEYPATIQLGYHTVTLRFLDRNDAGAIRDFGSLLSHDELMFLQRDITDPAAVDEWLRDIEDGDCTTVFASQGMRIVGCASVAPYRTQWMRHLAELQVVIVPSMRGKGLGRLLTEQAKAIAKQQGVKKLTVQMTADQGAPIGAFSSLGFRKEAYLRNHMIDHDGRPRDVQMLSFDVD